MVIAMDYKKKYKDLLERARKLRDKNCDGCKMCMESLFDELAESKDERIRKVQLDYWRSVGGKEWHGVPVQEAIAWLEKQAPKPKWSEEDDGMVTCIKSHLRQSLTSEAYTSYRRWLDSLKQRMGGEE